MLQLTSTTLTNSTVSGNTTTGNGGGIDNSGTLRVTNSTVAANKAASGGGINSTSDLDLINSTVSDNTAFTFGGGISIRPSDLANGFSFPDLINSTISDNTAFTFGGGMAIFYTFFSDAENFYHPLYKIDFCTIYGNTTTKGHGGGIAFFKTSRVTLPFVNNLPKVGIGESIVAGNHAQTDSNISGLIWSKGYNLFQNVSLSTNFDSSNSHSSDIDVYTSINVEIDPVLRKNGGPTQTHALLPNSPAIDRIPLDVYQNIVNDAHQYPSDSPDNSVTTDQRGIKRPQGNGCDIGAYEYTPSP